MPVAGRARRVLRCQALLRLRRGSDRSKYPILGCGYADRQVPGTLHLGAAGREQGRNIVAWHEGALWAFQCG